jgi:hypothetical protein
MQSVEEEREVDPGQLVVVEPEDADTVTASSSVSTVPSSSTEQTFEVVDSRRRAQPTAQERKVEERKALEKKLKG